MLLERTFDTSLDSPFNKRKEPRKTSINWYYIAMELENMRDNLQEIYSFPRLCILNELGLAGNRWYQLETSVRRCKMETHMLHPDTIRKNRIADVRDFRAPPIPAYAITQEVFGGSMDQATNATRDYMERRHQAGIQADSRDEPSSKYLRR